MRERDLRQFEVRRGLLASRPGLVQILIDLGRFHVGKQLAGYPRSDVDKPVGT